MIKNYKLALVVSIVLCSLDCKNIFTKKQYVILKNPACYYYSNIICAQNGSRQWDDSTKTETNQKYPKVYTADRQIFHGPLRDVLVKLGLSNEISRKNYDMDKGVIILQLNKKSLAETKEVFACVPNIYRIFNDYKKLENIIKKRDEEFGIKKKIGS